MKFTCPQCSAKYQIADEKVAGRTVKMKCRKCATVIPIDSASADDSTAVDALKPRSPGPPTVPAQLPVTEWHAGIGGSAVGPMTLAELQSKIESGEVTAETFIWKEGMDGWKPVPEVPEVAPLLKDELGPPSMPAVAKAQRAAPVAVVPAPALAPARVAPAPARSRAAAALAPKPVAAVSVRAHAPVAPAAATGLVPRASVPAPIPASVPAPAPAPAPAPVANRTTGALAVATPAAAAIPAPVASPNPRAASPAPHSSVAVPSPQALPRAGTPAVSVPPAAQATASAPSSTTLVTPNEAPIPNIAVPSDVPISDQSPSYDSLVFQLQKKRSNKWAIPFAVVAALALGLTVGFVMFGDQETKIIRQVVEVPSQIGEARAHNEQLQREIEDAASDKKEPAKLADAVAVKKTINVASSKNGSGTTKSATPVETAEGLKGLKGLEGLEGPSSGPSSSNGSSGGGKPLDTSQIQRTVSKYQTSVKRGCWQPALMSRDKDAPSSARVTVSITVGANGSVSRASAGGDPRGYRGLSSCISRKVRGWRFPRSSGTTTVNVPFVFATQ